MNRKALLFFGAILLVFTACKSKKPISTIPGGGEILTAKQVHKVLEAKAQPPLWVKITAGVEVNQNGSRNAANADIRMKQDSIIWVELSDKIVGIKAARAFAMSDTIAFYNRIERTYFAGSYNYVEKKLGTSLPFIYIFQVFEGQLFIPNARVDVLNERYVLSEKDANGNSFTAELEPLNLDCVRQEFVTPTDIIKITYADYRDVNGYRFPYKINVEVLGRQNLTATFQVNAIECNGPYKMPFTIGSNYERID